jgi:hypothetical protein
VGSRPATSAAEHTQASSAKYCFGIKIVEILSPLLTINEDKRRGHVEARNLISAKRRKSAVSSFTLV